MKEKETMRLSLNGATTMKADLATDVTVAGQAGFDLIEIWAAKLHDYLKHHPPAELNRWMDQHGVRAYSINSIEHITFRSPERHDALLAECQHLCQLAQHIGCPYIVVVPSPRPPAVEQAHVIAESVRVLRELSDIAEWHQVNLAFEFLGFSDCSVRTVAECDEIVRQVNRPNVGLVVDTFHFYVGGSSLDDLARISPERLFIFHINDAEDRPREELQDQHRLLPGEGILPLKAIWRRLQKIGYDRVISVELFRPEYWERNPAELAVQAREAVKCVLGEP
jgi:2-keto-myo-inositol isomerase